MRGSLILQSSFWNFHYHKTTNKTFPTSPWPIWFLSWRTSLVNIRQVLENFSNVTFHKMRLQHLLVERLFHAVIWNLASIWYVWTIFELKYISWLVFCNSMMFWVKDLIPFDCMDTKVSHFILLNQGITRVIMTHYYDSLSNHCSKSHAMIQCQSVVMRYRYEI